MTTVSMQGMARRDQGGFVSFKLLLILAVLWVAVSAGMVFLPAYYDFRVLKNLADQVVGEFADMEMAEVNRRVVFEVDRNNLELEPGTFVVEPLRNGGYSVTIDYLVTFSLELGEFAVVPPREHRFTYKTATPGRS